MVFEIVKLLDASEWFEEVTGLSEEEWMRRRGEFIECGSPVDGEKRFGPHLFIRHVEDEVVWDAGAFSVWSLSELDEAVKSKESDNAETGEECVFEIHVRDSEDLRPVEVSTLQADCGSPEYKELGSTMFQVASNFNCCENASYRTQIDRGDFVTYLMSDTTQGPAASSGAGTVSLSPFLSK